MEHRDFTLKKRKTNDFEIVTRSMLEKFGKNKIRSVSIRSGKKRYTNYTGELKIRGKNR